MTDARVSRTQRRVGGGGWPRTTRDTDSRLAGRCGAESPRERDKRSRTRDRGDAPDRRHGHDDQTKLSLKGARGVFSGAWYYLVCRLLWILRWWTSSLSLLSTAWRT